MFWLLGAGRPFGMCYDTPRRRPLPLPPRLPEVLPLLLPLQLMPPPLPPTAAANAAGRSGLALAFGHLSRGFLSGGAGGGGSPVRRRTFGHLAALGSGRRLTSLDEVLTDAAVAEMALAVPVPLRNLPFPAPTLVALVMVRGGCFYIGLDGPAVEM